MNLNNEYFLIYLLLTLNSIFFRYQKELEDKLIDLNAKLQTKEDTVKACVSQFQNLSDNLRKHVKFTEQIACSSFIVNDQEPVDVS